MLLFWLLLGQVSPSALDAALRQRAARPAPLADADLADRLSRHLVGEPMPPADLEAYAADPAPNKPAKLVDRLLADERYGKSWAARFRTLWLADLSGLRFTGIPGLPPERYLELVGVMERTLASQLNRDRSWDSILDSLITARGTPDGDPWVAYPLRFRAEERPEFAFAEAVSRQFLGVRLDCFRCHDHPFESWRIEDSYQMAAFESRRLLRWKGGNLEVVEREEGDLLLPGTEGRGRKATPRFFLSTVEPGGSALDHLGRVVSRHPRASRALANRLVFWLFGAGFTHPVDHMDPRVKPLSPAALDLLEKHARESGSSLKSLLRLLCLTEEYAARDGEPGFRAEALRRARPGPQREPWDRGSALPAVVPKAWVRVQSSGADLARFEVPPKQEGGPWAEFFWRRGQRLDTSSWDRALQVQGSRRSEEAPLARLSGRMHCDPHAGEPYPYTLLTAGGGLGKEAFHLVLQGPAETVEAWSAEFRLLLGR